MIRDNTARLSISLGGFGENSVILSKDDAMSMYARFESSIAELLNDKYSNTKDSSDSIRKAYEELGQALDSEDSYYSSDDTNDTKKRLIFFKCPCCDRSQYSIVPPGFTVSCFSCGKTATLTKNQEVEYRCNSCGDTGQVMVSEDYPTDHVGCSNCRSNIKYKTC